MRSIGGSRQLAVCLAVLTAAGIGRSQEEQAETFDLRTLVQRQQQQLEQQQRQIEELNQRLKTASSDPTSLPQPRRAAEEQQPKNKPPRTETDKKAPTSEQPGPSVKDVQPRASEKKTPTQPKTTTDQVAAPASPSIEQYLQNNPGAGMPPGVQTGFEAGRGFFIRSPPNPPYIKWPDEAARIPFELRIRGRIQADYYYYNVTDNLNHLTGQRYEPAVGDFSQLEVKRLRLFFEGTAFTPDLFYQIQLDGNTRGLAAWQNNRITETTGVPSSASYAAPGIGTAASPIGGTTLDAAGVRLFTAFVGYDIHLGGSGKGCIPNCPEGQRYYSPTLTFLVGKQQPFFGFTEILGSANAQFVDFAMADWFFDSDDNNMLTAATAQLRACDDRLFAQCQITNGNDSQFPNLLMMRLPGFIAGFWYDFGGTWDEQAKRYQLYGFSPSDLEWSPNPVVRVGGAVDIVPGDRASIYGDVQYSRVLAASAAPGGTRLINLLDGTAGTPPGAHALDKFDYYTSDMFASLHYRGFSLTNEWWLRRLTGFQTNPRGGNSIVYQDGSGANALFPGGNLFDFGTLIQAGYFLIPKKLEIVGRYSTIIGTSGSIDGSGKTLQNISIPGVNGPVAVVQNAFRTLHQSNEYAVGFNYFFYGQLLKWSSDISWYQGGNPAAGGASPAGFIPGVDGWLVRTQLQMAF